MLGFGCRVLAHDPQQDPTLAELGVRYTTADELFEESDIISLHCPLLPATHHLIDETAIERMKTGVMIINTSRGALIDTRAAISGLKSHKIGHLGLDVYEEEEGVFFEDLSGQIVDDDLLMRLVTFPNVLVTSHQAFLTREALDNIAETTLDNLDHFEREGRPAHPVT
jgi:D-lactate dehydrogenase